MTAIQSFFSSFSVSLDLIESYYFWYINTYNNLHTQHIFQSSLWLRKYIFKTFTAGLINSLSLSLSLSAQYLNWIQTDRCVFLKSYSPYWHYELLHIRNAVWCLTDDWLFLAPCDSTGGSMMMVESLLKFPPCLLAGQTANAAPTDMLLLSLLHNRRDIQKHALKRQTDKSILILDRGMYHKAYLESTHIFFFNINS